MKFKEATEQQQEDWRNMFCGDACIHGDVCSEEDLKTAEKCFEIHQEQNTEEFKEIAEMVAAIDEIRLVAPMMDRVDLLVRQLEELTKSEELTYGILAWMSSITTLERETIVADYLAQEAEQPRPSARISPEEFKDILAQEG